MFALVKRIKIYNTHNSKPLLDGFFLIHFLFDISMKLCQSWHHNCYTKKMHHNIFFVVLQQFQFMQKLFGFFCFFLQNLRIYVIESYFGQLSKKNTSVSFSYFIFGLHLFFCLLFLKMFFANTRYAGVFSTKRFITTKLCLF